MFYISYIFCFSDENITVYALKILSYDQLQELTKSWKIGDKAVFSYHFQKWREEINSPFYSDKRSQNFHSALSNNNFLSREESPSSSTLHLSESSDTDDKLNINVMDIFKESRKCRGILDSYKKIKYLKDEQRNVLINEVAQYFENNECHMSLQTSYKLERQMLTNFSSEKLEYYRCQRRGKIYLKFHNLKKSSKNLARSEEKSLKPKLNNLGKFKII